MAQSTIDEKKIWMRINTHGYDINKEITARTTAEGIEKCKAVLDELLSSGVDVLGAEAHLTQIVYGYKPDSHRKTFPPDDRPSYVTST